MPTSPLANLRLCDHAKENLISRNMDIDDVRKAVALGTPQRGRRGRTLWLGRGSQNGIVVVTGRDGLVITVYAQVPE